MLKKANDLKVGDHIIIRGYGGCDWNTLEGKVLSLVDNGKWITAYVDDGKPFQFAGKTIYKDVALDRGEEIEVA